MLLPSHRRMHENSHVRRASKARAPSARTSPAAARGGTQRGPLDGRGCTFAARPATRSDWRLLLLQGCWRQALVARGGTHARRERRPGASRHRTMCPQQSPAHAAPPPPRTSATIRERHRERDADTWTSKERTCVSSMSGCAVSATAAAPRTGVGVTLMWGASKPMRARQDDAEPRVLVGQSLPVPRTRPQLPARGQPAAPAAGIGPIQPHPAIPTHVRVRDGTDTCATVPPLPASPSAHP
jgi:hypothetical protein